MEQMSIILDPYGAPFRRIRFRALVVGQDEAIEQIVNVYQTYLTGLIPPGRPIGNFLFLGPTGHKLAAYSKLTARSFNTVTRSQS